MSDLLSNSISNLRHQLDTKKVSAVELTQLFLDRALLTNPLTHAYITISRDEALSQAEEADKLISSGQTTTLTGIPFGLKDAYVTQDLTTTCGSLLLKDYLPPFSATVYKKLLDHNAIVIGKHNQDAWGHGGSSENTDFTPVKNPWDLTRTVGGSSGGTAAALASDTITFAIGEDTGGSIRNPASFNNVCGLKVTYGRVSRFGAIAYASSLDTVGPMAKSVEDLSLVLEAIAGHDPLDASSSQEAVPQYSENLGKNLKGKKIGLLKQYFGQGLSPEVKTVLDAALKQFEALGVEILEVDIPTAKYGVSIYYVLALSETSSNLARYDGVRYGGFRDLFSPETKRRIMTGTFTLSSGYYDAYYKQALKARTQLIREFNQAFSKVDVIFAPVMPFPPYPLGEPQIGDDYVTAMYLADLYTCATNPVGIPSLAMPAGFASNLPVGMQLMGPMFSECLLLNFGHQFQQVTDFHLKRPSLNI